jgi:hypothetical protein
MNLSNAFADRRPRHDLLLIGEKLKLLSVTIRYCCWSGDPQYMIASFEASHFFISRVAKSSANIPKFKDEFFPSLQISLSYYRFIRFKNLERGNLIQSFWIVQAVIRLRQMLRLRHVLVIAKNWMWCRWLFYIVIEHLSGHLKWTGNSMRYFCFWGGRHWKDFLKKLKETQKISVNSAAAHWKMPARIAMLIPISQASAGSAGKYPLATFPYKSISSQKCILFEQLRI